MLRLLRISNGKSWNTNKCVAHDPCLCEDFLLALNFQTNTTCCFRVGLQPAAMSGARPSSAGTFPNKRMRCVPQHPFGFQHVEMEMMSPALLQMKVIYNMVHNLASDDKGRIALILFQFALAMLTDREVTRLTGRSKMELTCTCAAAAAEADAAEACSAAAPARKWPPSTMKWVIGFSEVPSMRNAVYWRMEKDL